MAGPGAGLGVLASGSAPASLMRRAAGNLSQPVRGAGDGPALRFSAGRRGINSNAPPCGSDRGFSLTLDRRFASWASFNPCSEQPGFVGTAR